MQRNDMAGRLMQQCGNIVVRLMQPCDNLPYFFGYKTEFFSFQKTIAKI